MSLFGSHTSIGLACGSAGASSVLLKRRSSSEDGWRICAMRHVSWKDEGIKGESEIRQAANEWLQEGHFEKNGEVFCALHQSEVNTVISDFPPIHDASKLSKMIAYQTQQLGGLSGISLVHSFQGIEANPGQINPMLIAVAREDALNKASEFHQEAGLKIGALVPEGLALYNAFTLLQPTAAIQQGLQTILHSNSENCTMLLLWNGIIQSISVLAATFDHPLELARSLQSSIRLWKDNQTGDARLATISRLWLSGENAGGVNLQESILNSTGIQPEILGIPVHRCPQGFMAGPICNGCYPAMTIPFGLAAQSLGLAPMRIALLPERIAWQQARISQFPFLAIAAAVVILSLCVAFSSTTIRTLFQAQQLDEQEEHLDSCLALAPKVSEAYRQIALRQLQMLPVAEAGLRTQRLVKTLRTWQECAPIPAKDSWCFYLADEFSFAEDNAKHSKGENSRKESTRDSGGKNLLIPSSLSSTGIQKTEEAPASAPLMPQATPVSSIHLLSRMYASGILLATRDKYQALKDFQGELNRSDTFTNVDDFTDYLSDDFKKRNTTPWESFLNENKESLKKDYALFMLQLPFKETPISLPQPEEDDIPSTEN